METLEYIIELRWLEALPLSWVKYAVAILFVALAAWAQLRKSDFIFEGAPTRRRWRDLRLWALAAMAAQVVIYVLLG